jgi:hypothetical protein
MLRELKVFYTSSSRNLKREIGLYVWEIEKDTGKQLNVPIDRHNHAIDSIRYATYSKYFKLGVHHGY